MGGDPPHADLCTACVRAVSPQRNAPCGIEHEHRRRGTCASVHNRTDVARMSVSEHHICKMSQGISVSEANYKYLAQHVSYSHLRDAARSRYSGTATSRTVTCGEARYMNGCGPKGPCCGPLLTSNGRMGLRLRPRARASMARVQTSTLS